MNIMGGEGGAERKNDWNSTVNKMHHRRVGLLSGTKKLGFLCVCLLAVCVYVDVAAQFESLEIPTQVYVSFLCFVIK